MSREIRMALWRALAFFAVLELMLVGAILFFPKFQENLDKLRGVFSLPMLHEIFERLEEGGVGAYVAAQHFFKGCDTLGSAAAILFAVGAVAGEAQRGTMEIWLARPVSRSRLLLERYVFGLLAVALPVFATSATAPWLLARVHEEMSFGALMLCSLHQSLMLAAVYSLAFLFSTLGRNPVRIAFAMLFLCTFEFAIYMVMDWTHYSMFRLADVPVFMDILDTGHLPWPICLPLAGFSLLCLIAALLVFRRRLP